MVLEHEVEVIQNYVYYNIIWRAALDYSNEIWYLNQKESQNIEAV
jgi:hypothetical protein